MWEATYRGLPACLYRPGNIGPHSVSGKANPRDLQNLIIDACCKVGYAPSGVSWHLEMPPVDTLVKAITSFAATSSHYGKVYNIVQQDTVPARAMFDLLSDMNLLHGYMPIADWKSKLETRADETDDYLLKLLAQSLGDVESQLTNPSKYDCSSYHEALSFYGIPSPQVNAEYLLNGVVSESPLVRV